MGSSEIWDNVTSVALKMGKISQGEPPSYYHILVYLSVVYDSAVLLQDSQWLTPPTNLLLCTKYTSLIIIYVLNFITIPTYTLYTMALFLMHYYPILHD